MGFGRRIALASALLAWLHGAQPARAWWENGHQAIAEGVLQNLQATGDLQRFIEETNDQFVKIPWIEPAGSHWIEVDRAALTNGNAGTVSYATDFANFRAGTFTFPSTRAAANARYTSAYLSAWGDVPWRANDTLADLTSMMQAAVTYDDWYRMLPTAGALAHYLQDMHQPMHLTQFYQGMPASGLHGRYEGGQFEDGSVWRYPELKAAMTPVPAPYYGPGAGFITALFNRIPTDFDKNVIINNAHTTALAAGPVASVPYYDSLWEDTKAITKDSFHDAAVVIAGAFNTAYINAGSPAIPEATFFATSASENSTITETGPVTTFHNQDFFEVRGPSSASRRYGVVRFDMARIKSQFDDRYGVGEWAVDNVALAVESNGPSIGSLKIFFAPNDSMNIQVGSSLVFADNAVPLGIDPAIDTPLLQYALSATPTFTITRFDTNTPEAFHWEPLADDIVSGDLITLVAMAGTNSTAANYFGGAGLSLEVSAHQVTPGDFNHDNGVDAADYVMWRKGMTTGEYMTWQQNFGESNGGSGSSPREGVPEPSSATLILLFAALVEFLAARNGVEKGGIEEKRSCLARGQNSLLTDGGRPGQHAHQRAETSES
jgi:hypothetical protein